ncbi:hypothetical protein [Motilibacter deserti]|uniref:Uncharacterized protein n=1 Tax=Motilibacter deserti TaxID=2714956 RepID=A0ABX0GNF6_9ACTN|nr:hypothetical protein [Motilibacter deserti]NHC12356.1 hypothetical protein [Motilibacter deserti]
MEILGGGQPEEPRPGGRRGQDPAEEVLSVAELQGVPEPDDEDEDEGTPLLGGRGPSAEALAIASVLLAVPTVTGSAWYYGGTLVSSSPFSEVPDLSDLVLFTSAMWAPGLVALGCAALSRRVATSLTRAWARHLADGSAIAVLAMLALVALGVLYNQSFVEVPEDDFGL